MSRTFGPGASDYRSGYDDGVRAGRREATDGVPQIGHVSQKSDTETVVPRTPKQSHDITPLNVIADAIRDEARDGTDAAELISRIADRLALAALLALRDEYGSETYYTDTGARRFILVPDTGLEAYPSAA